jgi:hypothetical protein
MSACVCEGVCTNASGRELQRKRMTMHVNVCVCVGVVVIVLVLVQRSRGGEGREDRAGKAGRRCTRQAGPGRPCGVVHAFATYLSRTHDPGRRVRAGGRSARRAGVCACVRGQSGEARNRPAQRQMRDETSRRHETGCWPGDASFGRQDATKTSQHPRPRPRPRPLPPPPRQPAAAGQRRRRSSNRIRIRIRIRTRDANRSAAAGYKRPLGPGGISAVPSCPVPGPGCRTCHLLAMPS